MEIVYPPPDLPVTNEGLTNFTYVKICIGHTFLISAKLSAPVEIFLKWYQFSHKNIQCEMSFLPNILHPVELVLSSVFSTKNGLSTEMYDCMISAIMCLAIVVVVYNGF